MPSRNQFDEVSASWWATVVFGVTALAGVLLRPLRVPAAIVAILLFVAGLGLMGATLVIGAGRSRTEALDIGGLFFSKAPRTLRLLFWAQVVIGLATAAVRPSAAFGVLAPIVGLGLCGLWNARHATFPPRPTGS